MQLQQVVTTWTCRTNTLLVVKSVGLDTSRIVVAKILSKWITFLVLDVIFRNCICIMPFSFEVPVLRAAINSPKLGLFILRRTSNCSEVNRTELLCSSSLSGSSWSSRVLGSSSPIDSSGTTQSSMGSSNKESCACLRFFLGAIPNSQEVDRAHRSSDTT
jgi:hypothetical protein